MIIAVQNQKGGVGKTTLAIHISYVLSSAKEKVLLLDTDPQGSARDWAAARESEPPFTVMALDRPTIHRDLPSIASDYAHVVIDGPPRVSELARSGIIASDLIVIPVQPSPYDVWAAQEVINLINEASVFKESLKALFVINRKIVNTAIGRDVGEALSNYSIPIAIPSTVIICVFKFSPSSPPTLGGTVLCVRLSKSPSIGGFWGQKSQSMTVPSISLKFANGLRWQSRLLQVRRYWKQSQKDKQPRKSKL